MENTNQNIVKYFCYKQLKIANFIIEALFMNKVAVILFFLIALSLHVKSQSSIGSVGNSNLMFEIVKSGDVDLGSFVKGSTYILDPPFNEINFTIKSYDNLEHTVILSNQDSNLGSNSDVIIYAEWYVGINTPFINGNLYKFTGSLNIKVKINKVVISSQATNEAKSFSQFLKVDKIN
jgi:hypothetical protein